MWFTILSSPPPVCITEWRPSSSPPSLPKTGSETSYSPKWSIACSYSCPYLLSYITRVPCHSQKYTCLISTNLSTTQTTRPSPVEFFPELSVRSQLWNRTPGTPQWLCRIGSWLYRTKRTLFLVRRWVYFSRCLFRPLTRIHSTIVVASPLPSLSNPLSTYPSIVLNH